MLSNAAYFVSKRALYVASGWLCLFVIQLVLASCTPEPVMPYAMHLSKVSLRSAAVLEK